jgi:hypothetical protein
MRRLGHGVFQRLWTQNQSAGDWRIWPSRAALNVRGKLLGIISIVGNLFLIDNAPTGEARSEDRGWDDCRIGADRQGGCQRRSRAHSIEKRHPDSSVARTLIDQHCGASRFAQEGDGGFETILSIEGFHALAPIMIDELVQIRVAQGLIESPKTRFGTLKGSLRVELPTSHVA